MNGTAGPGRIAQVLLPLPLPGALDYAVPPGLDVQPGCFVSVPLGARQVRGVVWSARPRSTEDAGRRLKPIGALVAAPPLSAECRAFVDFTARYTCHLPGRVLRMVMSSPEALDPPPQRTVYLPGDTLPQRLTAARKKVLAVAADGPFEAAELARRAGVSPGVVTALAKAGGLAALIQSADARFDAPIPQAGALRLNEAQSAAAQTLTALARQSGFAPALLDGVTGSGKTEVYFDVIADVLEHDPEAQILVLLPEIALTQDVLARFARRFGAAPAEWHSERTRSQRRRVWRETAHGRARIVVGARSALFLPFSHLRLIIVDEEHDSSYKQEEGVLYHARDMAVARAKCAGAAIILASATPSLESLVNARSGRYAHVRLPSRPGAAVLPPIRTIDLRAHPPAKECWLSPPLIEAVQHTLERGEQSLLFLNRRGYAPLTICRKCGGRLQAPDSNTYLVEHRQSGRLVCHLTGFSMPRPHACPSCGAPDSLHPVGPGVERLHEEAAALFPGARIAVFSSDTASTPAEVRRLISRMEAHEIDILIGTSMAAKGHNFPALTLVGVIDADMGLRGADLRAGERTYQTLVQVAGRAGRADRPGRALLQTWQPEHEAIQALCSGDRDTFLAAELSLRADMGFPPYGRLAALIVSAPTEKLAVHEAQRLAAAAPLARDVDIWGPVEPPFARLRGRWRRRLLLRAGRDVDVPALISAWRARVTLSPKVRLKVDIDPYSFL